MKPEEQSLARDLYLNTSLSQKEIAQYVAVSEKTIYLWIKQRAWDKLKQASLAAPAMIVDNLFSQLVELQNNIAAREEGNRFPTLQEAEITRKLILCMERLKLSPSQGACMQMMRGFIDFIGTSNKEFRDQTLHYAQEYLERKGINGYTPYDIAYKAKTPQEMLQDIETNAALLSEEPLPQATENTKQAATEISAAEIIAEPEIQPQPHPESQEPQAFPSEQQTTNDFPPPEKTGNSEPSSTKQNNVPPPSANADEEQRKQHEINAALSQMRAEQQRRRNKY